MSPKIGQKLTDKPKDKLIQIRMDKETVEVLDRLVEEQNSDRSKIIRKEIHNAKRKENKMIAGERNESIEAKRERHIDELKVQIDGWKNEIHHARKQEDLQYENYCKFMIEICEKFLKELEEYEIV